jgi:DNA polymerase elongation subunit (family B)
MLEKESVLVYDIETNCLDTKKAVCKWFGAYSYFNNEYYLLPYTEFNKIKQLISLHRVLIGFNNNEFDNQILENQHQVSFKYKNIIDLYEVCKKRLDKMGIKPTNFKLKTIIETLKLDDLGKSEIDYDLYQKDEWTLKEIIEVKKYLKQDVIITKKLFEWFFEQFKPLREYLSLEDKRKFVDVKSSLASLSFRVICNLAGLKCEFKDNNEILQRQSFAGGHHINPRRNKIKGNIVSIDFVSAYPHALMQCNLFSSKMDGWNGKPYFNIKGTYDNQNFGKVESALKLIFLERLKAKKEKDKAKNLSYKIVINALYGLTGNPAFKTLYNPITAGDCTSIVRTWLKKLAKTLEVNGYEVLYGFTDSVMVLIPEQSNKEELMFVVDKFIETIKSQVPFPQDTFKLEIEKELKFIWFVAKNCYLWVDNKNEVGYRSTLLNSNTPLLIMKVFNEYMKQKIIKELDINFTEQELTEQVKIILSKDISLSGEEYNTDSLDKYISKTSLYYQISEKYGAGKHLLIPNLKGIGVGRAKSTQKKIGVRYCTIKEYNDNNLKIEDIDIFQLLKHLKPFYQTQIKNRFSGIK